MAIWVSTRCHSEYQWCSAIWDWIFDKMLLFWILSIHYMLMTKPTSSIYPRIVVVSMLKYQEFLSKRNNNRYLSFSGRHTNMNRLNRVQLDLVNFNHYQCEWLILVYAQGQGWGMLVRTSLSSSKGQNIVLLLPWMCWHMTRLLFPDLRRVQGEIWDATFVDCSVSHTFC